MTRHFTPLEARRRMVIVGVVAPLAIAVAGIVITLVALPRVPNPAATHWDVSGAPNGFGSPWLGLLLTVGLMLGYVALAAYVARATSATGHVTLNQRLLLSLTPFLATVLSVIVAGSTVIQVGLTDARNAPSVSPFVIGGFAAGIALGVLAWFLLPASEAVRHHAEPAEVLPLAATARASWLQHIHPARALIAAVVLILVLAIGGGAIALWFAASPTVFIVYLVVMVTIAVLTIGSLSWRVTIDARGFRAICAIGFPRFAIPLDQVESAGVIEVNPVRDFGGWGLRWGGKRQLGVITRAGEALEVRDRSGRSRVVTVTDAATAAATLNALAVRA
jgi:uncharacterized membrane protein